MPETLRRLQSGGRPFTDFLKKPMVVMHNENGFVRLPEVEFAMPQQRFGLVRPLPGVSELARRKAQAH